VAVGLRIGGPLGYMIGDAANPMADKMLSKLYRSVAGESGMSVRMKQLANAQTVSKVGVGMGEAPLAPQGPLNAGSRATEVNPNAGKFGQGGGIGGWKRSVDVKYTPDETLQQAARLGYISDPTKTAGGTFNTELKALTRDLLKAHPAPINGTQKRFEQWLQHQQKQGLSNSQILSKINSVRGKVSEAPSISTKGVYDINNPVNKTTY